MFFAPLVPGLLVVLVGYLVGYGLTALVDDVLGHPLGTRAPEVVGWLTGLVLLLVTVRWLLRRRRHQK